MNVQANNMTLPSQNLLHTHTYEIRVFQIHLMALSCQNFHPTTLMLALVYKEINKLTSHPFTRKPLGFSIYLSSSSLFLSHCLKNSFSRPLGKFQIYGLMLKK